MVRIFAAMEDLGQLGADKEEESLKSLWMQKRIGDRVNGLQTYGWWGFVKVKFRCFNLLPITISNSHLLIR